MNALVGSIGVETIEKLVEVLFGLPNTCGLPSLRLCDI